jgi:hypothetical protein
MTMSGIVSRSKDVMNRSGRWLAVAALLAGLPLAAHASVIATFDWVPKDYNPASADQDAATGTLELTLATFTETGTGTSAFYTSGSVDAATVTSLSYTAGDGQTVNVSNLSLTSSTGWATSASATPAAGTATPAPTLGNYLVTGFSFAGTTSQGGAYMFANTAGGVPGTTLATGIPNGDNNFGAASSGGTTYASIADGGYWQLESVTPVPLPAGLPLLLGGLGLCLWASRRCGSPLAA